MELPRLQNQYSCGSPHPTDPADLMTIIPVRQAADRREWKAEIPAWILKMIESQMEDRLFLAAEGEIRCLRVDDRRIGLIGMGKKSADRSIYRWMGSCAAQIGR